MEFELPDLGAFAAWAILLIIAEGLWVLDGLLRNTFGRVPVIGPWVSRYLSAALNDARNAVLAGAGAAWSAGIRAMDWLDAFAHNPLAMSIRTFAEIYGTLRHVYDVTLPSLENRVLLQGSRWFTSAEAYAAGLWRSAVAEANALTQHALTVAAGWFATAERDARVLFDTATADIAAGVTAAETTAANALARASTTLAADITAAERLAASEISGLAASAQAAVNAVERDLSIGLSAAEAIAAARLAAVQSGIYTDLETWGNAAVHDAWPDAAGDIAALRRVLGADFPWLSDLTGALAGAGAAGLLGTLIRSMATSQAVTRLATDCVVPNCRNLSPFGRDLADLLGAASTAALLAWLVQAAADPAGWARDTDAVLGPIASGATQAARTLLGVG